MTHTDTQQAIVEIMESLGENIECDQLINKLVDKGIITRDDVTRITVIEEQDKMQELLMVVLEKDPALHPLALKILENLKSPSQQNTRRTEQAIAQAAAPGSGTVSKPSTERRILTNAEVSGNWKLKNFLFELSKEIGDDEFNDMKDLMHGESGFMSSALKKIERPMQFFKQMMNTGRLNAYNLHFLQALVRRIGRKDLNGRVRQFCLECHKQPIHFFTPSETPENGYRYVKHHIEGDIEKLTHIEKERLRAEVADILCVPLTFVYIKGIEPAGSLLFTFMVPEEDVSSFIHMYVTEEASLIQMSVHVQIQGEQLSLSEVSPSETKDPKPMLHQLRNLLEREQSLQEQLEGRDDKLMDLQAELDSKEGDTTVDQVPYGEDVEEDTRELRHQHELYRSLFSRMMEVMKTMQPREVKNGANGITGSLKLSSASSLYKHSLHQIMQHCSTIDMDLVNKLLDTRVLVENTLHEERLRKMQDIIALLNQRVEELGVMNGVLRMSSSMVGGSSTFLQDILAIQAQTRALAIEQEKQQKEEPHGVEINGIIGLQVVQRIYPGPVEIKLEPEQQQRLVKITKELSSKEKQKLKTFLCFSEPETAELKRHPDKLLELALMRELRKGRQEPMENILGGILGMIGKAHLINKHFDIPEPPPKITTRRSGEKRRYKRFGRSDTPQRSRTDSETNH